MPDTPAFRRHGPVLVGMLAHPAGVPAEAIARGWLADVLDVDPARIGFERGESGRPALRVDAQAGPFDCNWSHSGGRLAIALGDGWRVGIDIECPRPRPRALELARRYFTSAEADALANLAAPEQAGAFLRLWCAKEAVLKAHGRGLAFGLDRLRFDGLDGTPRLVEADALLGPVDAWRVEALDADGLVGMVAWRAREAFSGNAS